MPTLPLRSWLSLGGAALALATLVIGGWRAQPARAQVGRPLGGDFTLAAEGAPPAATPAQVEGLDANHFVVVTREARLTRKADATGGPWQNMLLTVVTHYTVQDNRLVAIEHVRVPQGYRAFGQ